MKTGSDPASADTLTRNAFPEDDQDNCISVAPRKIETMSAMTRGDLGTCRAARYEMATVKSGYVFESGTTVTTSPIWSAENHASQFPATNRPAMTNAASAVRSRT